MKAVVAAFNQEKALVGAFSVITNLRMELFEALPLTHLVQQGPATLVPATLLLEEDVDIPGVLVRLGLHPARDLEGVVGNAALAHSTPGGRP